MARVWFRGLLFLGLVFGLLFHAKIQVVMTMDSFPTDFMWGIGSSSYQTEGAWDKDGKSPNIWDVFARKSGKMYKNQSADIACASYRMVERDVKILKDLQVTHYHFSISWTRILPNGTYSEDQVNPAGVGYYNRLIDLLIAAKIKPLVTLYHWDLPQVLQERGGWLNPRLADFFNDYARLCFDKFGDRVKLWLTFYDPYQFCRQGYHTGQQAPGIIEPLDGAYRCGSTVLLAHANAYHTYQKKFKLLQNGSVSIVLGSDWFEPLHPDHVQDVKSAERALEFQLGWFAHPLFINGDFPTVMKDLIAKKNKYHNITKPRLTEFKDDVKQMVNGTTDFFAIIVHNISFVQMASEADHVINFDTDPTLHLISLNSTTFKTNDGEVNLKYDYIRRMFTWIKEHYKPSSILYFDDGFVDDEPKEDLLRVNHLSNTIHQLFLSIDKDLCDITGYFTWSLMDQFEWEYGFSLKKGLHYINFSDPHLECTPKRSSEYYNHIIQHNGFIEHQAFLRQSNRAIRESKTVLIFLIIFYMFSVLII